MSTDFLPFALPEIGEEEIAEVVDSLRSGWVTTGPKAKKFEEKFCQFLGRNDLESIAVNSATSGLHLALEAVGVGPGDEVILPTYTFTATAEVVRYLGATPVMVDIDPATYNISASSFTHAITEKTKAVIPVHFAGYACDMDEILAISKLHGIRVIEDAAHALPTRYKGQLVGTLDSDVTVFSFYANKTMTTGEGGMVVTANKDIAKRCKVMRLHGISRDAFDRYTSTKPSWSYEVVAPGYKYNMPDVAAAIGLHQLEKLRGFHAKRVAMAKYYNECLKDLPIELPPVPGELDEHAWHLYPIKLRENVSISRDDFIVKMAELGIGCSVHFIPLHLHPYWKNKYKLEPKMFPNAQSLYENEVSIPLYTKMTEKDLDNVVRAIKVVLEHA
ncbi:UDP-4-amino-4,6-dideoxy-N-acetyl-beta-L-altrosamine transaminase [Vibrio campbellii]|uniref:DegT/DnrJ/EryC1/StrS family aminotransferase n=1 Tax=Vibrio campbellii TaxID=680 RepID=UPI000A2FFA68|nr:DegT/DnrJ/EryC1/StrS family aminotransferase [Vibrio campbellii]ARR45706.1 UDP-4-amino-4,6-dideoxy-N-acetyl-beta-L-altrosamine transaminase [Vibrio campbellii]